MHVIILIDAYKFTRRSPQGGTALVRSGVQYNNITILYHRGAAHSCSSFADLVTKTGWEVKANFALTPHQLFMTRSAQLEQLWAAPPRITHNYIIILYARSY